MKKTLAIVSLIIMLASAATILLAKYRARELLMAQINKDVQNYYYISGSNGNELTIKQMSGSEYQYTVTRYPYSITEPAGKATFKLNVSLNQKFSFEKIGLMTGTSGANTTNDFPDCLISENDSSRIQRFYLCSANGGNTEAQTVPGEGKIYVSFKSAICSSDMSSLIDEYSAYGTVTWLWIDTYEDFDSYITTIQNPRKGERGVYGIPLFYGGESVSAPLDRFLSIINDKHACLEDEYENIRNGIKKGTDEIKQSEIRIIGLVLLPGKISLIVP